tara:strand:- start:2803 stop:3273 length:471 start_codon:yes stop_codon:yes gene_type:complete
MKQLIFILLFLPLFCFAQGPNANFIWSPNPACAGLPVYFIDASNSSANISIGYWSWNFSDGTMSTDQNPTHTFNFSGGYMVTLTVVDNTGGINDTTLWVEVDNCSTDCSSNKIDNYSTKKRLLKITNLFGRETNQTNQPLLYIYDDGSIEKRITIN